MEIGDLIGVVAAIRLDQHHHMPEAQAVNGKALVWIQVAGGFWSTPSGFDQTSSRLRNSSPPRLISDEGQMIQGWAVLSLRCVRATGQQQLHQAIA